MNTYPNLFRVRDITHAAGVEQSRASEAVKTLMSNGLLEKEGVYYRVTNIGETLAFITTHQSGRKPQSQLKTINAYSQLLKAKPDVLSDLIDAIYILTTVPETEHVWKDYALQTREFLLLEIDTAIDTLKAARSELLSRRKKTDVFMHFVNSRGHTVELHKTFKQFNEVFRGEDLNENDTYMHEYLRDAVRKRMGKDKD